MTATLDTPPDLPTRRRRVALLLLMPFLSLLVVFATPTTAHALDGAKVISGALKSPPAQIVRWTPAGRVITLGLGLAMLAYETRDMWWPTQDINPDTPDVVSGGPLDRTTANQYCKNAGQTAVMQSRESLRIDVGFSCVVKSRKGTYLPGWSFTSRSNCYNPSTGTIAVGVVKGPWGQSLSQNITLASSDLIVNGQTGTSATPCEPGSYPISVELLPQAGANIDILRYMNLAGLNGGYPESMVNTTTSVQCKDVATDQIVGTITATQQGGKRIPVPSCYQRYGPGVIPWSGTVDSTTAGVSGTTPQGTFSTDPDKYDEWRDCFGPSGLLCKTEVYVDGQRCTIGKDVCMIWWRIWRGEPDRVECRFGSHAVGVDQCLPLKRAYSTGHTISTTHDVDVITDPDVDPETPPRPEPSPTTPPNPNPTANPSAPPTTGPNPETPPTEPTPEGDPSSRSCYGDAWSWNPVDWVYVPVKCALRWAFVPRSSVMNGHLEGMKNDLDGSTLGNYLAVVQGLAPSGGSGCAGPTVDLNVAGANYSGNPLSACSGATATLAGYSRTIITVAVGLGALFACVRIVGRGFGWDPGLGGDRSA